MSTNLTAPRLNCEVLEPRDNPSGNVSVFVSGGIIFIAGDAANNRVQLEHTSSGDLFVHGFDNTLVNGQTSIYLGRGIPNGVRLDLGAGNDRAEMIGLVTAGSVRFDMGTGNDQAVVLGASARESIEIYAQDGDDDTYLSRIDANYVILDGGNGFDTVHADNMFTRNGLFVFNSERPW
jgi:hypothetical protein